MKSLVALSALLLFAVQSACFADDGGDYSLPKSLVGTFQISVQSNEESVTPGGDSSYEDPRSEKVCGELPAAVGTKIINLTIPQQRIHISRRKYGNGTSIISDRVSVVIDGKKRKLSVSAALKKGTFDTVTGVAGIFLNVVARRFGSDKDYICDDTLEVYFRGANNVGPILTFSNPYTRRGVCFSQNYYKHKKSPACFYETVSITGQKNR